MTALIFFGAVYGWCAGMIAYTWATTPKNTNNTGVRL